MDNVRVQTPQLSSRTHPPEQIALRAEGRGFDNRRAGTVLSDPSNSRAVRAGDGDLPACGQKRHDLAQHSLCAAVRRGLGVERDSHSDSLGADQGSGPTAACRYC